MDLDDSMEDLEKDTEYGCGSHLPGATIKFGHWEALCGLAPAWKVAILHTSVGEHTWHREQS